MTLSLWPGTRQDRVRTLPVYPEGLLACSGYPARCRVFWGRGRIRTCGASRFVCLRPLGHSPVVAGRAPAYHKHSKLIVKTTVCRPVHLFFVSFVVGVVSKLSGSVTGPACSGFPWVQSCSSAFRTDYRIVVASVHLVCPFVATLRYTWQRCILLWPSGVLLRRLLLRGSQGRGCPR